MPKLHENHFFEAKFWGKVKAEFYTKRSYLRWMDEDGGPHLIVSDDAPKDKICQQHQRNIHKMIEYVKKGFSKSDVKGFLKEMKTAVDVN